MNTKVCLCCPKACCWLQQSNNQHNPRLPCRRLPCPPSCCSCSTMSYILAPSLVAPRVCTKASALMALTYQVAHILGLVVATGLALALYGDIAGGL